MNTYPYLDIAPACGVEIHIRRDGKMVWISVDSRTILRISNTPIIDIIDDRTASEATQIKTLEEKQYQERNALRQKQKQERRQQRRELEQQNEVEKS